MTEPIVVSPAVCTACGCTCDDLRLHVEAGRIVRAEGACELGEAYFAAANAAGTAPAARIAGREATLDEALAEAARVLTAARNPLVYGLAHTTSESQRAAVRLADLLGATIDVASGSAHGVEALALQFGGRVTCTLGEVKNRADLVIYWGCNPAAEYPHHFRRYTLDAPGRWVQDRTMIVVDRRPDAHFEWLQVLRALVNGRRVNEAAAAAAGVDLAQAQDLVARMKQARFGVIFYGPRLGGSWAEVAAVQALAADLQQFTRFHALGMSGEGNAVGAEGVLAAETGYPFAVNLSRGYPRYGPGEFSGAEVLGRGEADAVLVVTADPAADLPESVRDHLRSIPVVVINPQVNATSELAWVHLTTAPYGVSSEGTVHRIDEIALPLRPSLASPYPTDEAILNRLCAAIEELKYA